GLLRHGWRLATAESLSCGDVARALADAQDVDRWFAGGVVRVAADADSLARVTPDGADVRLVVPHGEGSAELVVTTPVNRLASTIRFGSPADGRRRALLAALDLLRRALA